MGFGLGIEAAADDADELPVVSLKPKGARVMDRKVVSVGAGVAVLALLVFGGGSAGAAGGCASPAGAAVCAASAEAPFVTTDQAQAAATALWDAHELANVKRDRASLDKLDTGSELLEAHYALAGLVCKCWPWYWTRAPRRIANLNVYLPRQDHYPLSMLAQVTAATTGQTVSPNSAVADLVLTRASADQPWRIAMQLWDGGYQPASNAGFDPPRPDTDGYDAAVPTATAAAARQWPALLAAYYTHLKTDGAPPPASQFLPGPLTTGTDLTARRQNSRERGFISHYAFTVEAGPWLFSSGTGETLACASVREAKTITPIKPHTVFVQHDGPGQAWGPDLNSGYYTKIITTFEWPVCMANAGNGLEVIGPTSGSVPIHSGGVPAKLAPGMTALT